MGAESSGSPFQCSYGTVIPEKQSSSPHHGTRPPIPRFETLRLGKCDTRKWYYHLMNDWPHRSLCKSLLDKIEMCIWIWHFQSHAITKKNTPRSHLYTSSWFNPFSNIYINLDHLPRQGKPPPPQSWVAPNSPPESDLKPGFQSRSSSGAWLVACLEMVTKKIHLNDPGPNWVVPKIVDFPPKSSI